MSSITKRKVPDSLAGQGKDINRDNGTKTQLQQTMTANRCKTLTISTVETILCLVSYKVPLAVVKILLVDKNHMQLPNSLSAPSFVQTFQFVTDPAGFLEKAAGQYPDIFSSDFGGYSSVYVQHPLAIQEIFTNDRKKFVLKPNKVVQPIVGDYSIFLLSREDHKQRRQLLMPSFHGERIRSYSQLICDLTEQIISQLPLHQPFSARAMAMEIALQVILQAVFGLYKGERYQKLKHLLGVMLDSFVSPLYSSFLFLPFLQKDLGAWSPWGRFVRQREQVNALLYAEIAERRAQLNPERIDILSLLMEVKDEEGKPMTDQQLRDELMSLLFAGHETTATLIAWGLYWTHHVPEVGEKLRDELDRLGDSPDPMSIFRLPYLTAVFHETLRIYPPGFITTPRVVKEPVYLMGHRLEPGTIVTPCIYLTHHREDLYPQAKQFQPERFIERQYSPYEFLPFGGGVRRCLGEALATLETKLVLATIVSRCQLTLIDSRPERPQLRSGTTAPADGVKMIMTGQRVRRSSLQPAHAAY